MEWIDALTKEQLRMLLRSAAVTNSDINSSIRNLAREAISLDKTSFLLGRDDGLPKGLPLCLNKRKAQRWIENSDKLILSNAIIALEAVTEAILDCILVDQRPDAELFVSTISLLHHSVR